MVLRGPTLQTSRTVLFSRTQKPSPPCAHSIGLPLKPDQANAATEERFGSRRELSDRSQAAMSCRAVEMPRRMRPDTRPQYGKQRPLRINLA